MDVSPKIGHIKNAAGVALHTYEDTEHTSYATVLQHALDADADITGAVLRDESFEGHTYKDQEFDNVDFGNTHFSDVTFEGCIFDNCDFTNATFVGGKIKDCLFTLCDLLNADFDRTHFTYTDISQSGLRKSSYYNCAFENAEFEKSDVAGSYWYYTTFDECVSEGVNWHAAVTIDGTNLGEVKADYPILQLNGVGSQKRATTFFPRQDAVVCGCFRGTFDEFVAQVDRTYGLAGRPKLYSSTPFTLQHGHEYVRVLRYLAEAADGDRVVAAPSKQVPADLATFLFGRLLGPFARYETVYDE